jgi:HPt (histidine-containing phosphotransfer) domain-containing protein
VNSDATDRAAVWVQRLGVGFERSALERLLALDPGEASGLMPRLLEVFETSLTSQLVTLEAAAQVGDAPGCRRAAHAVRSSSNSMGALAFARACHVLELQALELGEQPPAGHAVHEVQRLAHEVAQQGRTLLLQVHRALRDEPV